MRIDVMPFGAGGQAVERGSLLGSDVMAGNKPVLSARRHPPQGALGSVGQYAANAVVDDSGSVVQRFRFKAFGLPAPNTAASGWETLSTDEWSGMSVGGWSVLPVNAAAGIRLNWGGKKQYPFDGETNLVSPVPYAR